MVTKTIIRGVLQHEFRLFSSNSFFTTIFGRCLDDHQDFLAFSCVRSSTRSTWRVWKTLQEFLHPKNYLLVYLGVPWNSIACATIYSLFRNSAIRIYLTPFQAAIIGLSLNTGAYATEIVRSALSAIDKDSMKLQLQSVCLGVLRCIASSVRKP